jgi:hypothetical protein
MTYCGISVFDKNMPTVGAHLVLRKGHPMMRRLNQVILHNQQRFSAISLKYYKKALEYDVCPPPANYKPLSESVARKLLIMTFSNQPLYRTLPCLFTNHWNCIYCLDT